VKNKVASMQEEARSKQGRGGEEKLDVEVISKFGTEARSHRYNHRTTVGGNLASGYQHGPTHPTNINWLFWITPLKSGHTFERPI